MELNETKHEKLLQNATLTGSAEVKTMVDGKNGVIQKLRLL